MRGRDFAVAALSIAAVAMACSRPLPRESPPEPPPAAAAGSAASVVTTVPVRPQEPPPPACGDPGELLVFASPERPLRGQPFRVIAVADHLVDASLAVAPSRGPAAAHPPATATALRHGGPPYFWVTEVDAPSEARYSASLWRDQACGGARLVTKDIIVHDSALKPVAPPRTALWRTRSQWSASLENLYSAWVEFMFEAPLDVPLSWGALHEVLRDRSRNLLFDHIGAAEDEQGLVVKPDCADLPYFLRAYFAFKLGLPFGWSRCSRGENGVPPTCSDFATSSDPFPAIDDKPQPLPSWADPARDAGGPAEDNAKRVGEFFRTTLADAVQSGAGRTRADDEESDYYPVALSVEALRPGTIFADPYGHVLVVVQRVPQGDSSGGVMLAVDGQPDGTVARKRFWRGNFLFAIDPALGSAGFKRFRPLVNDSQTGKLRRSKNAELADYSATDQYAGGVEGFYDKVDDVLSPAPLDPMQALLETIQALEEQVKTRVTSVDSGRRFLASGKPSAEMPDGAKIFETTGDWEDFSTPSRDLRLLVAIDVARAVPARVARRPERYAMPAGKSVDQVRGELEARLERELAGRKFHYARSDGSDWELALRDVVQRGPALEMAYNPNDCVEERWGAPGDSAEGSTCHGHAPAAQVAKMETYRAWFRTRTRPPR
jgi:hypothetical protein